MSHLDDQHHDMPTDRFLDDQTVEALLAGRLSPRTGELGDLVQLVTEMRTLASSYVPTPGPQLAAILSRGLIPETGHLSATAASTIVRPAPQAAVPPQRKKIFETLFGSALVKAAAVLTGLTLTAGGAAAADVLPQAAQDKVAAAMELVLPVDIPDSADAAKARRAEGQKVADEHKPAHIEGQQIDGGAGDHDRSGQSVPGDATAGLPQEGGRSFGENVSNSAPEAPEATTAPRPAEAPTASMNPGTSYRESAPTTQPEQAPVAEDNPGTSYQESAPTTQPEQTPEVERRGGSSYRESAPDAGSPSRP